MFGSRATAGFIAPGAVQHGKSEDRAESWKIFLHF